MNRPFKRAFSFVDLIELPMKPRKVGLIEIRGPYYEAFTVGQLEDLLKTWGHYIDGFKFAGGSQGLLGQTTVKSFIDVAHQHGVYVNTGGFLERVIIQDINNVDLYLKECHQLGFDVVEVSSGMFHNPSDFSLEDQLEIVRRVKHFKMKPKPEITIMSGVGGGTQEFSYSEHVGVSKTVDQLLTEAKRFFEEGAYMLMIESEGLTEGIEDPAQWRKDVITDLIKAFGHEKLMFEVSPEDAEARKTFKWYLQQIHRDINLMMNSKNIVEFNAWRLRLWGDRTLWQDKTVSLQTR